jgi:hypothetical protein
MVSSFAIFLLLLLVQVMLFLLVHQKRVSLVTSPPIGKQIDFDIG